MSKREQPSDAIGLDRRSFCATGVRAAALIAVLPAASLVSAGCGGSEEGGTTAGTTPTPKPTPDPKPAATEAPAAPTEAPAPAPTPAPSGDGEGQLVTEIPAVAAVVKTLQYVNESPKADQNCSNCQLYTAGSGGRGKCQLFVQGLVKETGWCASWVAKVS